jgi:exodeoxyribonuclease III
MNVVSVNVNGIRAAARKGFFAWMEAEQPDMVCMQEIKAQPDQLTDAVFAPQGYQVYWHSAERKGYSGVALYCRQQPDNIQIGLGEGFEDFDIEGRYIQADFGALSVASLYLPSGSAKEERQAYKYEIMDRLMPVLDTMLQSKREYILCGDWNIAHKEIDLKNWKANQKNSGFLPEERAWLDKLFARGWVDGFRHLNPEPEHYTWWSNRGKAWEKNVGWRIDYHIITPGLADTLHATSIYKEERFSDHAPLLMEYQLSREFFLNQIHHHPDVF